MISFVIPTDVEESRCETLGISTGSVDSAQDDVKT
jgi:hypothetical protein